MGFSFFASMLQSNSYMVDSVRLFLLGTIIESGRRFCQWLIESFWFQYFVTAQFTEGDPAYEWIILFLTQENVWKRSCDLRVTAASSLRKWGVQPNCQTQTQVMNSTIAEYVPVYKRSKGPKLFNPELGGQLSTTMYLTIYTRDMSAITSLVEHARQQYLEISRPNVVVHTAEQHHFGPSFNWSSTKNKVRRPLSSIILPEGVIDSIVRDAREFSDTADRYVKTGIPHRRGYLLYGPPGTGKSSTIYALAGELGLEIYSLSLASGFVDDNVLQRAVAAIPKESIFLIEDIDCAFPSREDEEESQVNPAFMTPYSGLVVPGMMSGKGRKSNVTLSGLLNVLDGVGSEEGKLFFATTNFVDHLDPAILRPGRIDRKIQYKLATKQQAIALFCRFYPEFHTTLKASSSDKQKEKELSSSEKTSAIQVLAEKFAEGVPEHEFSTAELQGYLLTCKKEPERAVEGVLDWVVEERKDRVDRENREAERKAKRDANQLQGSLGSLARLGIVTPSTATTPTAATTTTVGQQLVGPVLEQTVTTSPPIINLNGIEEESARHVGRRSQGVSTTSTVGQQPLGSGPEPTVTTTTTTTMRPNTRVPMIDLAAIQEAVARRVQEGGGFGTFDEGPSYHKPIVNGTTDSGPVTPY